MYRSVILVLFVYLCDLRQADGGHSTRKYGCMLSPNICTPPEGCSDDGLIGNCQVPFKSRNWKPVNDDIPLVKIQQSLRERGLMLEYKSVRDALYDIYYGGMGYGMDDDVDDSAAKLLHEIERVDYDAYAAELLAGLTRDTGILSREPEPFNEDESQEYRRSAPQTEKYTSQIDPQTEAKMKLLVGKAVHILGQSGYSLSDLTDENFDKLVKILAKMLMRDEKMSAVNGHESEFTPTKNEPKTVEQRKVVLNSSGEGRKSPSTYRDDEPSASLSELAQPVIKDNVLEALSSEPQVEAPKADQEHEMLSSEPHVKPHEEKNKTLYVVIIVVGATVLLITLVTVITCCVRVYVDKKDKEKIGADIGSDTSNPLGNDYQELCRQHYASKNSEQNDNCGDIVEKMDAVEEPLIARAYPVLSPSESDATADSRVREKKQMMAAPNGTRNSSLSSTSWSEEPVTSSLDITTGHAVLSYMEDHLNNRDRLDEEWEDICSYEADRTTTKVATAPPNSRKNRAVAALPYDHNRVILNPEKNHLKSDYINASTIIDNDPKRPLYIATQGPLVSTIPDFWQMIWEQRCVAIVMLTPLAEEGVNQCARYWPDEGSCTYHQFEIHLVSEHIWCEDYLVRSLYLKNLETGDTRTVTQFHFLSWPNTSIPPSPKPLLELRRKVTKCYKGHNSPVLVHCSDGIGRTGTYILLDLAIDRMLKGAKEIDISATLEHVRDQRAGMVRTKQQFEFALTAVAEEVNAILKSLLH